MVFGEKLQSLRKSRGWTQEQLAERAGVSRQTLSKWELGTAKPDADNIVAVSKIFGVSTDYLLIDDYTSDEDLPAVRQSSQQLAAAYKNRFRRIIGIGITVVSLIGLLLMGILASVYPAEHVIFKGNSDFYLTGIQGFLMDHNLGWLFAFCILMAAAGILVIIWPKLVYSWSKNGRARTAAGLLTAFSVVGIAILYLFSNMKNFWYTVDDWNIYIEKSKLGEYLECTELEGLFRLCMIGTAAGILTIVWTMLWAKLKRRWPRLARRREKNGGDSEDR